MRSALTRCVIAIALMAAASLVVAQRRLSLTITRLYIYTDGQAYDRLRASGTRAFNQR